MNYDRNPKYVHPFIADQLTGILQAINAKLPSGFICKMVSGHRTPEAQFELYKKGRAFVGGAWRIVDKSKVVTHIDGYTKKSRHNYFPSTAIDIGIFDKDGNYQSSATHYRHVKEAKQFGLDWGGDWVKFVDMPHLEIPRAQFYKSNIEKDCGSIWQQYLIKAGTYTGVPDGIFGPMSLKALAKTTGETERNMKAWDALYEKFGKPDYIRATTLFG